MVSILIKQKLLISEVLDALEYQSSQEKRPLKPLNKLSLYIAGMLWSHQCDTTPQAQTNTLSGTLLLWVNSRMSKVIPFLTNSKPTIR